MTVKRVYEVKDLVNNVSLLVKAVSKAQALAHAVHPLYEVSVPNVGRVLSILKSHPGMEVEEATNGADEVEEKRAKGNGKDSPVPVSTAQASGVHTDA